MEDDEDELERLILAYSPQFQRILRVAEKQIQDVYGIPDEEHWKDVEGESRPESHD